MGAGIATQCIHIMRDSIIIESCDSYVQSCDCHLSLGEVLDIYEILEKTNSSLNK